MNKASFDRATKFMQNEVRSFDGITVGRVCWHNNQWKLLPEGTKFEDIEERGCGIGLEFFYKNDLWDHIKKSTNIDVEGEDGDNLPIACDKCHTRQGDDCQCVKTN